MMKSNRLFLTNSIMKTLPSTRCFGFKRKLLSWAGANIGKNVQCASNCTFLMTGTLSIGFDTWLGTETLMIGGSSSISIGNCCDVAPRTTFVCGTHEINMEGPRAAGKGYSLPIRIGNGCWIGTGAVILGGTEIGELSVVAAGAVVKGRFPDRSLIGGIPAKIIKTFPSNFDRAHAS